ncbi:MAG TPA: N-6 DNA methylase [Candidatus Limnocylindrales bacterium]|nr:N-6 DNA methylase [Candidatus Limnocylindrales bacterium]
MAENLAEDFGPESAVAQQVVAALVGVLTSREPSPRAQTLFSQWALDLANAAGLPAELDVPDWLALCTTLRVPPDVARRPQVLFALQTYFGIVSKLVCLVVLEGVTGERLLSRLTERGDVWSGFEALESGQLTASTGAVNAIDPGVFSWYVSTPTPELGTALRHAAETAAEYSAEVVEVSPITARDLMKDLFQRLLPRALRHRLGEYYTPDWLAEFVLDQVGYDGNPDVTLLDPACGSGTFLVVAISRIRAWFSANIETSGLDEEALLSKILKGVTGFDLSPLAVMAARTNYLIAVRDLLRPDMAIELPVYLCDSVLTPVEYGGLFAGGLGKALELRTSVGSLVVPRDVTVDRATMAAYSDILRTSIENEVGPDEFLSALAARGIRIQHESLHRDLYAYLDELARSGSDGVWASIIRNSFAPVFQDRVDFVVGNPPWVFWTTLPPAYREEVKRVMVDVYRLAAGGESTMRRLGSAGKDLSALFVYVSLDRYLKNGGRLGFVITQTLFQSTAADEFREWQLPGGVPIGVKSVDDWVRVRPFKSAANKTATFVAVRGEETAYPVPYRVWTPSGRFDRDSASLATVRERTSARELKARPSNSGRRGSFWTISDAHLPDEERIATSPYRARRGVETGLESVYRVRPLGAPTGGRILVENIRDRARRPVQSRIAEIETSRLFPYVSGASITRWRAVSPGLYLVPHTHETGIRPIPEEVMRRDFPKAHAYLGSFKAELETRPIHRRWGRANPYYALYDIGPYTFARWKVVWKRTTRNFEAAVVSTLDVSGWAATVVPNGKVMMIGFDDEDEAHYVCSVLNSSQARTRINSAISSEAHGEVLDLVDLPQFDPSNELHNGLAHQAKRCTAAVASGATNTLDSLELQVDTLVARLWERTAAQA